MTRPFLKVEIDEFDRILEFVAAFAVIFLVTYPLLKYESLPDIIPRHFNARGEADGFGSKATILLMPAISVVMYGLLTWLNTIPHLFNYAVEITQENAAVQYRIAMRMLRTLKALILCIFAYMTYATIQTALGQKEGLGASFLIIFLTLIFGSIGYFLYQSFQKK